MRPLVSITAQFANKTKQPKGKFMHQQNPAQAQSLLKIEQVSDRIQLGRSWIWDAVKRGEFPAPKKLSRRCTRWDSRLIDEWIQRQLLGTAG